MVSQPYDPQTLNRYSYVLNNPLRYTDPTGHIADPGAGGLGSMSRSTIMAIVVVGVGVVYVTRAALEVA